MTPLSGKAAVDHINAVIREGDPENTLLALKKPEAQLPAVYPFAAVMYQDELLNLQKQSAMVSWGDFSCRDFRSVQAMRKTV